LPDFTAPSAPLRNRYRDRYRHRYRYRV